jgi:hypothetical protein
MRREFYLSRGQEVPDEFIAAGGGGGPGDGYEEHVRALEEQWIEGDLNAETAESGSSFSCIGLASLIVPLAVNEGLYSSIFHGILIGFLFPLLPWFFFREIPSPNFFDPLEGPDAPLSPERDSKSRNLDPEQPTASRPSTNHESPPESTNAASMFGLRGLPGGDWRTSVVFGQRTQVSRLPSFLSHFVY